MKLKFWRFLLKLNYKFEKHLDSWYTREEQVKNGDRFEINISPAGFFPRSESGKPDVPLIRRNHGK